MVNKRYIDLVLIAIVIALSLLFYFYNFIDVISLLPYSDEIHAYYLPGINYFNKDLYNIFNQEAFQFAFGHPPIFHLTIWLSSLFDSQNIIIQRSILFAVNSLSIFVVSSILLYSTKSIILASFTALLCFSSPEIYYYLHQFIPEIVCLIWFVGIWLSIKTDRPWILFFSSVGFMLTREYSILFIPILFSTFLIRKITRTPIPNSLRIKFLIPVSLILTSWFFVHKINTNNFIDVFATKENNFIFEFNYWFKTISEHIYDELYLTKYIYFLPLVLFILVKKKSIELIFLFMTTIGFFSGLSFYNISIDRYLTIGIAAYLCSITISISYIHRKSIQRFYIFFLLVVCVSNISKNQGILNYRYDGSVFITEDYKILTDIILPQVNIKEAIIYTDHLYIRMCEMENHFNNTKHICSKIRGFAYWDKNFKPEPTAKILYRGEIVSRVYSTKKYFKNISWFSELQKTNSIDLNYYFVDTYEFIKE